MRNRPLREVLLLLLPSLLILGGVLFVQVRNQRTPFFASNVPIHAAFFGSEGEIVSIGVPVPTPAPSAPPVGRNGIQGVVLSRIDTRSGDKIAEVNQTAGTFGPTLSPDGRWLASISRGASGNYFLHLRQVKNGFYEHPPVDTESISPRAQVWDPQSKGLYLLSRERVAYCDLKTFTIKPQNAWKRVFDGESPTNARFSPDGKLIALTKAPLNIQEDQQTAAFKRPFNNTIGNHGDVLRVCSWPEFKTLATFPGDSVGPPTFTRDGRSLLATACFKDGFTVVSAHVARLDLRTKKTSFVKIAADARGLDGLQSARFSPDGRILVASNFHNSHSFYSALSGRLLDKTRDVKNTPPLYMRHFGDFSSDSSRFLSVWPSGIEIHDLTRMKP